MKQQTIITGTNKAIQGETHYNGLKTIGMGTEFNNNINADNVIEISNKLSGKMQGMTAITTSPYMNPFCKARLNNNVGVCAHCFSAAGGSILYPSFIDKTVYNSIALSTSIIPLEYLPRFIIPQVRLESHGDIINVTHAINYINIATVNPNTIFTLWTKNPNLLKIAFREREKPANLIIIYSSQKLNQPNTDILNKYNFIDKVFTVYTADYSINNNININCGNKNCITCKNCYRHNNLTFINEILKQDIRSYINKGGQVK